MTGACCYATTQVITTIVYSSPTGSRWRHERLQGQRAEVARECLVAARQRDIDMPPPRRCSGTPAGSPSTAAAIRALTWG
jgi:hypothetical protein